MRNNDVWWPLAVTVGVRHPVNEGATLIPNMDRQRGTLRPLDTVEPMADAVDAATGTSASAAEKAIDRHPRRKWKTCRHRSSSRQGSERIVSR